MLRKIHYKIAMAAGLCIVVAVVTLALVVVNRNNALQQQVMAMTSQELSQKAENELQKLAEIQAGKVIEPLTKAMEVTRGITNTMKSFLLGQRPELLDRVAFSEYTRDVLVQNPDLMGTYIAWEEGVGDGRDAEFAAAQKLLPSTPHHTGPQPAPHAQSQVMSSITMYARTNKACSSSPHRPARGRRASAWRQAWGQCAEEGDGGLISLKECLWMVSFTHLISVSS